MNPENLKVLLLGDAGSVHIERFYAELQNQGCDVLLASLENGTPEAVKLERVGDLKVLHYRLSVKQIISLIDNYKPDVISAHYASGYGHIAALANRKFSLPLCVHLWGSDILIVPQKSIFHRFKTKITLKSADHVFADSQYLIDKAKKIYPFKSCSIVPWGVEKEISKYFKPKTSLKVPLSILVPRAHEEVYNNQFIVEALQDFIKLDKINITFPAFGSLYDSFQKSTERIVGDKINYYEKKERDAYLQFASEHDIFLSASLSDSSPVTLLEAMALGMIPVVMQIDGVKEWISDKNGFMFEHTKVSLRTTIDNLLQNKHDLTEIIESNRKRVESTAIFENNMQEQISIFKFLVEKNK